jgi:prepilin-type N-terminal cleavage/methylation domain-containing protein
MIRRRAQSAFTLLELVMVMLIIAIIAGMVAPSIIRFSAGQGVDNFGHKIIAAAKYARTQSIGEARTYRLNFDAGAGQFWLTADAGGGNFKPVTGDYSQRFTAPKGIRVQIVQNGQAAPSPVVLLPWNPSMQPQPQPYTQPTELLDGTSVGQGSIYTLPQSATYFQFRPTGRTDPANIALVDARGRRVQIVCTVATDTYHMEDTGR